jgi:EAL domain-containing protein (putative c-di-GMP-specific phosphodiesterase class I)/DNA-binding NarL/FixJ family response regulator
MKALIVADDPEAGSTLRELLQERAHHVTACTTAAEAMEGFRETTFPLLFIDLDSPDIDGFSLCRWIRNQPAGDQPVILVGTSSGQAAHLRMILEAGADDYIVRPYEKGVVNVRLIIASRLVESRETNRRLQENLQREQEQLDRLTAHDPLTRLLPRPTFTANFHDLPRLAAEIREAIRTDGFEILFQPIVDVQTALPVIYEVLLRLPGNREEVLPPGTLALAAERHNLMAEIDRQVITKALKRLVNNNELRLAINLSGQSFDDPSLPEFIRSSFRTAGVEPKRVTFEITETAMISDLAAARMMMHRLHETGFRFALDDFGAGYSSFSYLKNLCPDYLKIDGNFVRDAEIGRSDWIFVEVINEVAHRLKIKSVAEFVEQEATLAKLREIGVDFAQGYLFGKPGPAPS